MSYSGYGGGGGGGYKPQNNNNYQQNNNHYQGYNSNNNNNNNHSYGGGGGGGQQGGFLNSSDHGIEDSSYYGGNDRNGGFSSSQQNQQQQRKNLPQAHMPVTIKQLLNAEYRDSKFRLDGATEISQITLVAQVLKIDSFHTNISYQLTDSTGEIPARKYTDESSNNGSPNGQPFLNVDEMTYVRVVGNLRILEGGQRAVLIFHLKPITDTNEITYHYLDAILAHCRTTRTLKGGGGGVGTNSAAMYGMQPGSGMGNHIHANVSDGNSSYTPLQSHVLNMFIADQSDNGASVQYVTKMLAGLATAAEVRQIVDFLSDNGQLYTTCDDDHYKYAQP